MTTPEKNSKHYTASDIERYLNGSATPEEMHALEKAALGDPFLAEAIEGMQQAIETEPSMSIDADVRELRRRLQNRVSKKRQVVPFSTLGSWARLAAVVLILIICGSITYYFLHRNIAANENIAIKKDKASETVDSSIQSAPAAKPTVADS